MSGWRRFLRAMWSVLICVTIFVTFSFTGVLLMAMICPDPSDLVLVSYMLTVILASLAFGVWAATKFSRYYTVRHTPWVRIPTAPVSPGQAPVQTSSVPLSQTPSHTPPTASAPTPGPTSSVSLAPPQAPTPPTVALRKTPKTDPTEGLAKWAKVEYWLSSIDLMEGHDFEIWAAGVLREMGFHQVTVTQASNDQGVDVLAEKDDIRYAIQCKRYTADLGNTPVQEVHAGKDYYHCHVGVVLTNRYFTANAKALAAQTGTLLWDRDWIKRRLHSGQGLKYIQPQE